MELLNSCESKEIDRITIEKYIPGILLMERAAINIYEKMRDHFVTLKDKRIVICCGGGNNGGDGFALARHLFRKCHALDICFIGQYDKLPPDAKENYNICKKMGMKIHDAPIFVEEETHSNFFEFFEYFDIIVDALIGVGLSKGLEGHYFQMARYINDSDAFVVSVDLPTGVSADTGEVFNIAVKADITVTFHKAKPGHFLYPGRAYTGKLEITDIGIPEMVNIHKEIQREAVSKEDVELFVREKTMHKGTAGKVFILAGSKKYSGASFLSVQGALRSGVGMVHLAVPNSITGIMQSKTSEAIVLGLTENSDGTISAATFEIIIDYIKSNGINSMLIGPGLGRNEETLKLIRDLIKNIDIPIILDADGLYAVQENMNIISNRKIIATPHEGEFLRLLKKERITTRITQAEEFAKMHNIVLVLKGADTIVTNGKKSFINTSGNPGMAVGGMGDVLAGIITGLVAQRYDILEAAKLGVFLHGYTGDILAKEMAEEAILPTDIIDNLGKIMKELY